MTIRYVKTAKPRTRDQDLRVPTRVAEMLREIEDDGEARALAFARELDHWDGDVVLDDERIATAKSRLDDRIKDDICFAHDNIRRFADAQRATLRDMEIEIAPGFSAGQKSIPVYAAGCYAPGGRFSHVASALMTVTTAKAAGVAQITACSPPRGELGLADEMIFAMNLAGADRIMCIGGVQAIAAMAYGLFGLAPADILVGPGNSWVAEAKRQLFGRVGIDMVAGPTDSMVLADSSADAQTVAWDLVGQMEHGADSPVWLVTNYAALAEGVIARVPSLIETLPEINATAPRA